MTAVCLQLGTVIGGVILLICTFRKFVARKLTEELAICWSALAILFIVTGCCRKCFCWSKEMHLMNATIILCVLYLLLFVIFYTNVLLTGLIRKNQELAIMVSLLNQENESMIRQMKEFDQLTITREGNYEKENIICN